MFSIITPTYKRPTELMHAVQSVLAQGINEWEMIIVNDNPGDDATKQINNLRDPRIIIFENSENKGVNFSRNRGLDNVSKKSEQIIFLDDDDTLAPDALSALTVCINKNSGPWIVTARGSNTTTSNTIAPFNNYWYSYLYDYLVTRRFKGDATHCIATSLVNNPNHPIRFAHTIKQGEEWLFYSELGTLTKFYYKNIVTTLTHGYDTSGLNFRRRSTRQQLSLIPNLITEANGRKLYTSPLFWVYVMMRTIRAFIK